jgi:hypothetical protein
MAFATMQRRPSIDSWNRTRHIRSVLSSPRQVHPAAIEIVRGMNYAVCACCLWCGAAISIKDGGGVVKGKIGRI